MTFEVVLDLPVNSYGLFEASNGLNPFFEQKALKRPQALPYLSVVVGARAVAAREEAVLRRRSNSRLGKLPTEESFIESVMISLKNSLCGLSFLGLAFCCGGARLD